MNLDYPDFISLVPFFGVPEGCSLRAVPLKSSPIEVTKIYRTAGPGELPRITLPSCDAYLVMLYLDDTVHCDIKADGSLGPPRFCGRGSICLVDLCEGGASVSLQRTLSSIAITLPKSLIAEVAALSSGLVGKELRCRRAERDPVISNLGTVLLSLFERKSASSEAILGHLGIAVSAHLLQDCLDVRANKSDAVLSHHRQAVAKEFIRENLARELSVSDIAAVTGLSANHFSQAFRRVTGLTPHQWLVRARVDAAKEFLSEHQLTLREIAKACGFVDQSHFTKVFAKEVGVTPAAWKNRRVN
ncbi:helix-turn-helix transcriptional regulator [Rhizobium sp. P32RR-XVIII]|uniref:helix-turn-helix domain-containing protein n=1 Tax=Rhizobium sp. P32RR-XVIII TaxID=2726738 RepID=UPI0014566972|nr:AraC family transcriptional regulator [Rhizobium sp. P32RR-XVIII]NLS07024.1 helix-turn-helix transcriptional regulator [Rhizobium sp. P32RR-XVIII]